MTSERDANLGGEELLLSLPEDAMDYRSNEYRRRLQYLAPNFGFHVPFGYEWFRSEEDARMFLEATAKHLGKNINHLSKNDFAPLFLDLFDKACNMYKMRIPFSERPMHVNRAIGLSFAHICAHKSDKAHAHREKMKTTEEKHIEARDSEGLYRGNDQEKLWSNYWAELHDKSIIGKYVATFGGRKMEHITRHIVLGVLEGSPDFYFVLKPSKSIVMIKNSSITKERNLVREGQAKIGSSRLSEVVRELHRQFLQHDDTEISAFADETEREAMDACQPMTSSEYEAIHDKHSVSILKSTQHFIPGPAASKAPFKPAEPPRRAPLLAPGNNKRKASWLSKKDQRRVDRGRQPRYQVKNPSGKRKAEGDGITDAKRHRSGLLGTIEMGSLPIRGKPSSSS